MYTTTKEMFENVRRVRINRSVFGFGRRRSGGRRGPGKLTLFYIAILLICLAIIFLPIEPPVIAPKVIGREYKHEQIRALTDENYATQKRVVDNYIKNWRE